MIVFPLSLPLRQPTPHGTFGSPRYVFRGHSSANPFYEGQPVDHVHQGVDLIADPGELIYAGVQGKVVKVPSGVGGVVVAIEVGPSKLVFADLGKALVKPGDVVNIDTPVAVVASRGFVHVAVYDEARDKFVDPKGIIAYA